MKKCLKTKKKEKLKHVRIWNWTINARGWILIPPYFPFSSRSFEVIKSTAENQVGALANIWLIILSPCALFFCSIFSLRGIIIAHIFNFRTKQYWKKFKMKTRIVIGLILRATNFAACSVFFHEICIADRKPSFDLKISKIMKIY